MATVLLKEKVRAYYRENREAKRNIESDALRFGLGEIQNEISELGNLTVHDVRGMASMIKRRKRVTSEEMYKLNHAFLQSVQNIKTFADVSGAVDVLVKEFTGPDVEQQIRACETLCNMSLGNASVCTLISQAAGSYFITYLGTSAERIKRIILWTVANIVHTSRYAAMIMIYQGIIPKVVNMYYAEDEEENYCEEAALVISLLVARRPEILKDEHYDYFNDRFHLKEPTSPGAYYHMHLMFKISTIVDETVVSKEKFDYLIDFILYNFTKTPDFESKPNRMRILGGLRVLSNLLITHPISYDILHERCAAADTTVVKVINRLFTFKCCNLYSEILFVVKTLINNQKGKLRPADLVGQLVIPIDK